MTTGTTLSQRIVDAFNSGDVDAFAACFAPDAVQLHPFFPEPLRGREAIRAAEGGMFSAFDHISMDVLSVLESGNHVAVELRVRATNSSPLPMPGGDDDPGDGQDRRPHDERVLHGRRRRPDRGSPPLPGQPRVPPPARARLNVPGRRSNLRPWPST